MMGRARAFWYILSSHTRSTSIQWFRPNRVGTLSWGQIFENLFGAQVSALV